MVPQFRKIYNILVWTGGCLLLFIFGFCVFLSGDIAIRIVYNSWDWDGYLIF